LLIYSFVLFKSIYVSSPQEVILFMASTDAVNRDVRSVLRCNSQWLSLLCAWSTYQILKTIKIKLKIIQGLIKQSAM